MTSALVSKCTELGIDRKSSEIWRPSADRTARSRPAGHLVWEGPAVEDRRGGYEIERVDLIGRSHSGLFGAGRRIAQSDWPARQSFSALMSEGPRRGEI